MRLLTPAVRAPQGWLHSLAWRPLDPSLLERAINPMTGPLTTRFAATFVLVAGVGISLFTDRKSVV